MNRLTNFFADPVLRLYTGRHTAEQCKRQLDLEQQTKLTWEDDESRRPSCIPSAAFVWTTTHVPAKGNQYLYVLPSKKKKGKVILRSRPVPKSCDRHFAVLTMKSPAEYEKRQGAWEDLLCDTIKAAKTAAKRYLAELIAEREGAARRARISRKRARVDLSEPKQHTFTGLTKYEQYMQDIKGLEGMLTVDLDSIPQDDEGFERWRWKQAFTSDRPKKTEIKTTDGGTIVVSAGKDRFGMRLGSRAAAINEKITGVPRSMEKLRRLLPGVSNINGHVKKLLALKLVKLTKKGRVYDPKLAGEEEPAPTKVKKTKKLKKGKVK